MIKTTLASLFTIVLVVVASFAVGNIAGSFAPAEYAKATELLATFMCVLAGGMAWFEVMEWRRGKAIPVKEERTTLNQDPGS